MNNFIVISNIVVCLVVLLSVKSGYENRSLNQENQFHTESFFVYTPQDVSERIIVEELKPVNTKNISQEHNIYHSYLMAANSEYLTINDPVNKNFTQFDSELRLVRTFGSEGNGPGEFRYPMSISTDTDGNFWFLDDGLKKITVRSSKGRLINEFPTPSGLRLHRLSYLGSDKFVLFSLFSEESLHIIDENGRVLSALLNVRDLFGVRRGFLLDGSITSKDGIIYYSGIKNDLLKAYTSEGELLYSREIIAPLKLDLFNMEPHELRTRDGATKDMILFDDKLLLIHLGMEDEEFYRRYLDIYDRNTGNYLKTYLTSHPVDAISIQNNSEPRLIVLGHDPVSSDIMLSTYDLPF
ncbi:MAG: hypothetical protein EA391_10815 [Balneolaceae bacterium]|nr:MAG: hypothetical protein EA391_10815 [Balneolaceae bacterium]